MLPLRGTVQHYDWGDPEFIPRLLGIEPDGRPWAELWLGTHPSGPTLLASGTPLVETSGELPYLMKVLAAARPLSLQTHPDAAQARAGYDAGRYADPNAKPELLCALTRFEALCGIRPAAATIDLLERIGARDLARVVDAEGPGGALDAIYRGRLATVPVVEACSRHRLPETAWVGRLESMYPGQPSVVATLLLNLVVLEPGQAIALGAGNLHAYLGGAGIELMGPSDNVIRGGLTTKAVDVDELLRIVDPSPLAEPVLPLSDRYRLADTGIALLGLEPGDAHRSTGHELGIELDGSAWYLAPGEEIVVDHRAYVVTSAS